MLARIFPVLLILCSLIFSGCATQIGTSPKGLELPIEKAAIKLNRQIEEGGYKVISAPELAKKIEEGHEMVLIDTMPSFSFKKVHIVNAVNSTAPKTEKDVTPSVKESMLAAAGTDKSKNIVVYCGFVACGRSHVGAKILVDNGYTNVSRFPAGIVGWKEGGFPLGD